MSAEVIAFHGPHARHDHEGLLAAVVELHGLIIIDPIMGASPVRIYFVLNPVAKAAIATCLADSGHALVRVPSAFALVAYDFPYALFQVEHSGGQLPHERAKAIVTSSADLQGVMLPEAAAAFGIDAQLVKAFDADALKAIFFPDTQESVVHVYGLELHRP